MNQLSTDTAAENNSVSPIIYLDPNRGAKCVKNDQLHVSKNKLHASKIKNAHSHSHSKRKHSHSHSNIDDLENTNLLKNDPTPILTHENKSITKQDDNKCVNKCQHCSKSFKYLKKHEWRCKMRKQEIPNTLNKKWTYEDNRLLLKIYYSVKPNERGYRQRLYHKWKQTGKHQSINEQNLSDKVRYLIKQNYFSSFELNSLKLQPENMQINIQATNTENHNQFTDVIS